MCVVVAVATLTFRLCHVDRILHTVWFVVLDLCKFEVLITVPTGGV